jgi:ribosomal protein S18 acetylase RimI-like enzyme
VLLVSRDNDPVGYAVLLTRRGGVSARLYSIAVSRGAAGRGIGSMLLHAAEDEARRRGVLRVHLEVRADNSTAIRFYEKAGYRPIGQRPDYYEDGATALLFARRLTAAGGAGAAPQRRLNRAA